MVLLHDIPYLEEGVAHLDAERLGLVGPGHRASVVVGEHDDRPPVQLRTEDPFARGEEIVTVGKGVHGKKGLLLLAPGQDQEVVHDHGSGTKEYLNPVPPSNRYNKNENAQNSQ